MNENYITLSVSELEKIFQLIFDKIKFEIDDPLIIKHDLYRYIPTANWDTFENEIIETGSLFDDLLNLKKLALDSNRPCTYVDFDRLAFLLRQISEQQNPPSQV